MRIKVIRDGHIDGLLPFSHKWCCDFWNSVCPDAGLMQKNHADESHVGSRTQTRGSGPGNKLAVGSYRPSLA
jgi:hypothetical protein